MTPASWQVRPARRVEGTLHVPGDKSISHRCVILAGLAQGETRVSGFLRAQDTLGTLEAVRALGVEVEETPDGLRIQGTGPEGLGEPDNVLDLGNSGTGLRLLAGLLAGLPFFSVLSGDASLRRRPMGRIVRPLQRMGARITGRQGGERPPLAVQGGHLEGMAHDLPMASAQVKSALLLAGLLARGKTTVTEPGPSRDHTERLLRHFGVPVHVTDRTVAVAGGSPLTGVAVKVPGDFSSAAFFVVAATLLPGSMLVIQNVGVNPTRTGLLDVLQQMGAAISMEHEREVSGEPVADLVVRHAPLHGVTVSGEWVVRTLDEFPAICVAAALADGETVIREAAELRVKESDRIATMAEGLGRMGVSVEEMPDGLRIHGPARLQGAVCQSHGDHRVAMALAMAGLAAKGETVIEDTACVGTSFPGFLGRLDSVAIR